MKKNEILELLSSNNVTSANLKTFINRNKKLNLSYERCFQWLKSIEAKERLDLLRKSDLAEAKKWKMSVKKHKALKEKARSILGFFHTGHSMGCYRNIYINKKHFYSDNILDEYSNSCKYRPTYGAVKIVLSKTELEKIENIEGVWTIKGKAHAAKWLDTRGYKGRFEVFLKHGFLFGDTHGDTLEQAKADFAKKIAARKAEKMKNTKFVGVEHVRKTGACMAGIKAFADRHGLNLEYGYNLGYLKSLENSSFLNRI